MDNYKVIGFYLFLTVSVLAAAVGGVFALIYGEQVLAGALFTWVGGGAFTAIKELFTDKGPSLKMLWPMAIAGGVMLSLAMGGCNNANRPAVDGPCAVSAAMQCASAFAGCVDLNGGTDDSPEVNP